MCEFQKKYPQPIELADSAYDSPVPRSIQADLDYITGQQSRIFYLDNRVIRLEQLLRNREHALKVSNELIQEYKFKLDIA
jgi:hypothetical protein